MFNKLNVLKNAYIMQEVKDKVLKISLDYINTIIHTILSTDRLLVWYENREEYEKCAELYTILLFKLGDLEKAKYQDFEYMNKENVDRIVEKYTNQNPTKKI